MDTDDDSRPTHGLLVSLLADATGRQRLLFDDVRAAAPPPDTSMFLERFYATAPRDAHSARDLPATDDDYRDLGKAVIARLLALAAQPG